MRAVILLALVGTTVAVPKAVSRIIGGSPTTVDQYPYMSNMQWAFMGTWWYQTCGGSLINSRSVLSAAHCYIGDAASDWRVRLGTSFASTGGDVHNVQQLILHPQYDHMMLNNDVAIVRLATNAVFSNVIQPARIAGTNYALADGTVVFAIGYGSMTTELLHHVDVNIINQEICAERYAYLKSQPIYDDWPDVTDNMLCSGILDVGGKDTCQGDSGGPLAHQGDIVVGITSWSYRCADHFYPGVNARVSMFTNWIVETA